jgi:sterol desaturase/sphingolipid hydroxylase (fatty acid hydroxylase superfamily)
LLYNVLGGLLFGFLIYELPAYLYHRFLLHRRWGGFLYRMHRTHHEVDYPLEKLRSAKYFYSAPYSNFFLWAIPFFLLTLLVLVLLPMRMWPSALMFGALTAYLSVVVHESFHLTAPAYGDRRWFRRLRWLHDQHHADTRTNFGIWHFIFDRLLGSAAKR